jgi:sporulation protein YlmC with PRC-barrel domain
MESDATTESATAAERDAPVTEPEGKPVYGRDGLELGVAGPVVVDLDSGYATALTVEAVDERRYPHLSTGPAGVRVPYDRVRGVADVVVLDVAVAAFRREGDSDVTATDVAATANRTPSGTDAPSRGAPSDGETATESDRRLIE